MLECKHVAKDLAGDKWSLSKLKGMCTDDLWTYLKSEGVGYDRDDYLGLDKCVDFDKDFWF